MPLFLLVAACSPGEIVLDTGAPDSGVDSAETDDSGETGDSVEVIPPDTAAETGEDTGDTGAETGADTGEDNETWPKACEDIYDQDTFPTFELDMEGRVWDAFASDCSRGQHPYHPVTFTYDGETVEAQARLKGNWSWSCDKLQFVISFNETDSKGRFHGLRKIVLDAPWYDRTLLHERLAFPLFERRGLAYSCANNARLEVNGEYYGVYANLERLDHEYLERNFGDPSGNLYQAGSELKTNEDKPDTSDIEALNAATTVAQIDASVDLDQAVAEWATEAMLPAMDNYWAGVEINYYLYNNPGHGFVYLPYDLDLSFGDGAYTDGSPVWPDAVTADPITWEHPGWRKEVLVQRVLSDAGWCNRFVEELRLSRAAFDPEAMAAQVDEWDAQIGKAVAEDSRKPYSTRDHAEAVADLKQFLVDRAAFVDGWLADGGHCPARW